MIREEFLEQITEGDPHASGYSFFSTEYRTLNSAVMNASTGRAEGETDWFDRD